MKEKIKNGFRRTFNPKVEMLRNSQLLKGARIIIYVLIILSSIADIGYGLHLYYEKNSNLIPFAFGVFMIVPTTFLCVMVAKSLLKKKKSSTDRLLRKYIKLQKKASKKQKAAEKKYQEAIDDIKASEEKNNQILTMTIELGSLQKDISELEKIVRIYKNNYLAWIHYDTAKDFARECWKNLETIELFSPLLYATNKNYKNAVIQNGKKWIDILNNPNWELKTKIDRIEELQDKIISRNLRKPENYDGDLKEIDRGIDNFIPQKISKITKNELLNDNLYEDER